MKVENIKLFIAIALVFVGSKFQGMEPRLGVVHSLQEQSTELLCQPETIQLLLESSWNLNQLPMMLSRVAVCHFFNTRGDIIAELFSVIHKDFEVVYRPKKKVRVLQDCNFPISSNGKFRSLVRPSPSKAGQVILVDVSSSKIYKYLLEQGSINALALAANDRLIYSTRDGKLNCFNIKKIDDSYTLEPMWKKNYDGSSTVFSLITYSNYILVVHRNSMISIIHLQSGELLYNIDQSLIGSDIAYAHVETGRLLIGTIDGSIYCFNVEPFNTMIKTLSQMPFEKVLALAYILQCKKSKTEMKVHDVHKDLLKLVYAEFPFLNSGNKSANLQEQYTRKRELENPQQEFHLNPQKKKFDGFDHDDE